jgi:hypothetical protein
LVAAVGTPFSGSGFGSPRLISTCLNRHVSTMPQDVSRANRPEV